MLSLLLLMPIAFSSVAEENIQVLDDENFTEVIANKEAVVLFYDSSCSSSNSVLIEFKAAASLYPKSQDLIFGKINLYSEVHVPNALKVYSGPRVVYITSTQQHELTLELTAANIINFTKYRHTPSLPTLKKSEISEFLKPGIISFILFEEIDSKITRKVAQSLRFFPPINIAVCSDPSAAEDFGLDFKSLYAINTYHDIHDKLSEFTYESIVDFVLKRDLHKKMPLAHAYDYVIDRHLPAVYLFRKNSEDKKYERFLNESLSQIEDLRIVYGDLNEHTMFSKIIGVSPSSQPLLMLIESVGNTLHKFVPSNTEVTMKNVAGLVADWRVNKAKKYYRQGEPVKGELHSGNYAKIIENTSNDLLVNFYAPWCEHCTKLDKDIEEAVRNLTNVRVMKFNAEENEVPGHVIEEYPTLKFYSAVPERWFEFKGLSQERQENTLAERIVEFVKTSRKDKRTHKAADKNEL